ncbi:MAG: hypothetical protein ABFS10_13860 [Bacteroidota bacterium]
MFSFKSPMTGLLFALFSATSYAVVPDSLSFLTGVIYNEAYQPVRATHVINMNSHVGDVSDSLGIFRLPVYPGDTLLLRNISYLDTLVPVTIIRASGYVILRRAFYPLLEARVFKWGSTYDDFSKAIVAMPTPQSLGGSLGLPRADPDHIPYDMNETLLKSRGFMLTSPVSYLYHNLSKKEKSRRKVYWNNKNREKHEIFNAIVSPESISGITGLSGDPLLEFMAYLFQRMVCDFKCTEFKIYSEIYSHWDVYQQLGL